MTAPSSQSHNQKQQLEMQRVAAGLAAAVFYGVCSGSMSFINKAVLTTYDFDFPCFIMFSQMIFTVTLLTFLGKISQVSLPTASVHNLKICCLPSLFWLLHAVLALHALSGMNIAMYTVLKRCVPLMNLLLTPLLMKKGTPRLAVVGSVLMMTAGCFFAGMGDLTFDLQAYTYGMLSVVSQSLYLTLVQSIGMQQDAFSPAGIMYLNCLNCLLPLFAVLFLSSEISGIMDFEDLSSPRFLMIFALVVSMGCVLNYAIFLCTILTSALTTSVVGVIKSVVVVAVGMFTLGGAPVTLLSTIGICMNTLGSSWYTYDKYRARIVNNGEVDSVSTSKVSTAPATGNINGFHS
ncbi:UDP-galactose/UDP-glucose transporter 7-like [Asterias rubens]|uniref:UDP-galactose/UDP-glucose transporter 7-like n=1 Tax=Asterias rubens TaxID=7604 RepID=UPI001454E97E|nr:UDP-galactose/UDP-glucose transporter 7-like [Asterias rubens]